MRKVIVFILSAAVLFGLASSVALGGDDGATGTADVRVEPADPAAAPQVTFFGGAHGSVTPGDLFSIDATDSPPDISVSLYLTNADALVHYLRYLILRVALYAQTEDGRWQPAAAGSYLTLQNSPVRFSAPGNYRYKVRIDSGSYYCLPAGAPRDNEPPEFYLTIDTG